MSKCQSLTFDIGCLMFDSWYFHKYVIFCKSHLHCYFLDIWGFIWHLSWHSLLLEYVCAIPNCPALYIIWLHLEAILWAENLWCPKIYAVEFMSICALNTYTIRFLCSLITIISNSMRNTWLKVVIVWVHICKWLTDPLWFGLKLIYGQHSFSEHLK